MKATIRMISVLTVLVTAAGLPALAQAPAQPPRDFSSLSGPYLGQAPPGTTPRVFAPNAVSTAARELNSVFTPDGNEFYFTIQGEDGRWTIMRSALERGRWTTPTPAPFSGRWSDVDLFITADGRQLYFCSNRPVEGDTPKDFDIWVCDRAGAGWSAPRNLGAPINSPAAEFYPTLTRDGTMYFQSQRLGGHGAADIWRARLRAGRYVDAECLPGPVNTNGFEGDALIAPDESYLIVSTQVGATPASAGPSVRRGDALPAQAPPPPPPPASPSPASPRLAAPGLFLSVPRVDGTWSPLVSLGDAVNAPLAGVNCQMLSPDGRYLFFTRGADIYWVDAAILVQAKRRALETKSPATQQGPPEAAADIRTIITEVAGTYDVEFQGRTMVIVVFEKDGKLIVHPEGMEPEEMLPVKGDNPLKFEGLFGANGNHFEIEFGRNDNGLVDRMTYRSLGIDIAGKKRMK